jgi:hypothetical protein
MTTAQAGATNSLTLNNMAISFIDGLTSMPVGVSGKPAESWLSIWVQVHCYNEQKCHLCLHFCRHFAGFLIG